MTAEWKHRFGRRCSYMDGFTYNYGGGRAKYGKTPYELRKRGILCGRGKRSRFRSVIRCIRNDKRGAKFLFFKRIKKEYLLNI